MIPSQVHDDVSYKQDQTHCVNNKHKDKISLTSREIQV